MFDRSWSWSFASCLLFELFELFERIGIQILIRSPLPVTPSLRHSIKVPVIAFFTNRQINKGEELTIDYFLDAEYTPSDDNDTTVDCLCGSTNCRRHRF